MNVQTFCENGDSSSEPQMHIVWHGVGASLYLGHKLQGSCFCRKSIFNC